MRRRQSIFYWVTALGILCLLLGGLTRLAAAEEMTSESFRLRGGTFSSSGTSQLQSTEPAPTIGTVGATLGQPGPVGVMNGPDSRITLVALGSGFWHIVAGLPADTDGDAVVDGLDNCRTVRNELQTDSDLDGIGDACDNCRNEPNADCLPGRGCTGGQLDDDGDGYGNVCDGDFTEGAGDGFINVSDLLNLLDAFGQNITAKTCPNPAGATTGSCARYDLTAEGQFVNVPDLLVMIGPLFGTPESSHGCAEDDTGVVRCPLP